MNTEMLFGFGILDQDGKPYFGKVVDSESEAMGYVKGIKDVSGLEFSYVRLGYKKDDTSWKE